MKKWNLVNLVLVLSIGLFSAQMNRFVYQASMKNDAADKNKVKTEIFNLDVDATNQNSVFYSKLFKERDSVVSKMRETRNFNREAMEVYRNASDYSVSKNWTDNSTTFKKRIARDNYEYIEDREIKWVLLPETNKIGQYNVQKATCDFAGRKWTAWFTNEIPFQEGPYKFKSLPGLIVKVEDSTGDYSFDLMESKNLNEKTELSSRGQTLKVKRAVFEKQLAAYKKDPSSFMNTLMQGVGNRNFTPSPEMIKRMQERLKEDAQSDSNPLEM